MNVTFTRKRNGSYEGNLSIKGLNVFAQAVELAKLKKEGYNVYPSKYEYTVEGKMTDKIWLYKAYKGNHTISIYA